jgi:para-nitrobenzyl esterase
MHRQLILLYLAATLSPAAVPDVVKVETGRVKGAMNNGIVAFKGIPFGKPPIGALRWKAP